MGNKMRNKPLFEAIILALAILVALSSCPNPAHNSTETKPDNPGQKTTIVFDNSQGICAVSVYSDSRRRNQDKITDIDPGNISAETEWTPGSSVPFYFTYIVNLIGINGLTINFIPQIGKDQKAVRIDANVKTNITLPKLDETLSSPDELLSNSCYLLIQNNSSFSYQLLHLSSPINPDNSLASPVVNSGEQAQYTINPGTASDYHLLVGADYKEFTGSLVSFEAGHVYSFAYDGSVSLLSETEAKLGNVVRPIGAMGAVTVSAGDKQLLLSWVPVLGAGEYDVYYSTNSTMPGSPAQTVSATTATISGLSNGVTYYVWVRGKNINYTGSVSSAVSGKPLGTPGAPTLTSEFKQQLAVTWTAVAGADQYEVYYGTDTPSTLATTTTGTSATISGLNYDTTYYVRLRAKNSNGFSDYGQAAVIFYSITPGLYRGNVKIGDQNLSTALSWISTNAVSGDDYTIVLGADETISPQLLYYHEQTVGITLLGYGSERTVTLASNGAMFVVDPGTTFTLDENITLVGRNTNDTVLVYVFYLGKLIMNDGTKISGNNAGSYPGGAVYNEGTFIMNGGAITGNATANNGGAVYVDGGGIISEGIFILNDGTISGNTASSGGGIYLTGGALTMNGGTISGNTASNGGGVKLNSGIFIMNGGAINQNTVANSGGGIHITGGIVTINYGAINDNKATIWDGGGISGGGGALITINDGIISGNSASRAGGGICIGNDGTTLTIYGGIVRGNSNGGGICVWEGNLTMYGGIISGNTGVGIISPGSGSFRKLPSTGSGQNSGIIYGSEATGNDADGVPLKNSSGAVSATQSRSTSAYETDQIDTTTGKGLSASGNPPYGQ